MRRETETGRDPGRTMIRLSVEVLRASIPGRDVLSVWDRLPHLPAWYDDALCAQVDNEIFFPGKGGSARDARAVCAQCPVATKCLDYALASRESFGIWGGATERERRKLLRDAS